MRRGFTLVEVTIIVAIITIVAALTIPNIVSMTKARTREEQYNDILRLAQMGREAAIKNGLAYVLTVSDGNGSVVTLAPEDAQDSTSLRDTRTTNSLTSNTGNNNNSYPPLPQGMIVGSSPGSNNSSAQQVLNGSDDPSQASAPMPDGVTLGQLNLGSDSSNSSDFKLHFYPEGRSEGGGFEMVEGATTRTLSIDRNGFATLKEGTLTPATEQSWEAGTYEQRASS